MANLISARLSKGDCASWGFRLQGGKDFGTPLIIQKINSGSPADRAGLRSGDAVIKINNIDVFNLRHKDAQDVILRAGPSLEIAVQRGGLLWKPAVSPVGTITSPRPTQSVNNLSPVTSTSLAAGHQENIGAIGTSHNNSAKPFAVNGGPPLVNKQYNSPLNLYSEESIAETISAQSEVLSNGVVGVNFKKNEKCYDSTNSAVFRMVQEADKEPRDYYEPVKRSDFYATHSHAIGSHRLIDQLPSSIETVQESSSTAVENQQVTTCSDCGRVIVGVFVRIKEKNLHVECFKCATCGTSLKNVGYYNLNNKLYCDVHAKLAVKSSSPNLVPVTVPPGGKIPSGTISAALASHHLPSPGSLSPTPNYTPVYQPVGRPYSGASAPISPTNNLPKYSPNTVTAQPEPRCVQNTIWPPPSKELELPTASPLYFPPPSQVQIPQNRTKVDEPDPLELEDMSYKSFGSSETRGIYECYETVSDSIETQMLVDSVMKSKQPTKMAEMKNVGDVSVSFTITELDLKKGCCGKICESVCDGACVVNQDAPKNASGNSEINNNSKLYKSVTEYSAAKATKLSGNSENTTCQKQEICVKEYENKACLKQDQIQSIASIYEKAIKVENTVPHKWESQMVTALTVAPDYPYSPIPSEPDLCLPPPKQATSALAAALVVAPAEPFTPLPHQSVLEPVALPEFTEPYFPPEHPVIIEPKESPEEHEGPNPKEVKTISKSVSRKFNKKSSDTTEDYIKELPKPTARMTMLTALTTAPDRPYSPFSHHEIESTWSESCEPEEIPVEVPKTPEPPLPKSKPKVFPKPELCAAVFTAPERLYSPFTANKTSYETEVLTTEKSLQNISTTERSSEKRQTKNIETTENVTNISTGCPPLIHCIRSTFETDTDKVHMEMSCAFPSEPVITKRIVERKSDVTEENSVSDSQSLNQLTLQHKKEVQIANSSSDLGTQHQIVKNKAVLIKEKSEATKDQQIVKSGANLEKQHQIVKGRQTADAVIIKEKNEAMKVQKDLLTIKNGGDVKQQHQTVKCIDVPTKEKSEITESTLIQQACSRIQIDPEQRKPIKEQVTVIQPGQTNLNIPQIAFQPVTEISTSLSASSLRPRSLTPSMINKPASVLPYYQANLVAVQQPPAEGSVYDPKTPVPSRSPSPYPGQLAAQFPSSNARAVSPAPGPPPNPLKSNIPVSTIIHDSKLDQARNYVQTYIPQHVTKQTTGTASFQETRSKSFSSKQETSATSETKFQSNNTLLKKETLQISGGDAICIQRKKVVTEEYERCQNSRQIEKRSACSQVSATEKGGNAGAIGMHVTNPQPLKSPFIREYPEETDPKPAIPFSVPKKTIIAPAPNISSDVNVKPNVSQPNAGTGGGRQSGAVGVAPKRGRGVLNLAATPGSRVPLCGHCHTNIRGPFITALGKIWCPEHFSCATPSCRRPLQDLGFVEEQGQLYCEFCFEKYLAPLCAKCNTKVKGDCLKAIGKTFHPECFNCAYCGKLFGNSPFFLEDGQPYCENDWNELFTTKCFACGFPVEAGDRWVEALNNNYHTQCFNCTMCKKNLEGQSFFAKGGRPFCKNHAR